MFKLTNRLDGCYQRHSRRAVLCTWRRLLMLLESCSMSLSENGHSDCYRDAQWTGWIHSRVRGVQNIKDGCIFMLCNVRLYFQNSVCLSAAPIVCDHRGKYVAVLDYQCEQDSAGHW